MIIWLASYPKSGNTWLRSILVQLLFDKNDLQKMNVLRRIIAPMGTMDAIEFINSKLKDTKNNAEIFNSMNKPA